MFILGMIASVYGMDISNDTGQDQSLKIDAGMNVKKGNEQKSSNRKYKSGADAQSYSVDLTFDPIPIYLLKADRCAKQIAVAGDFGLSAVMADDEDVGIDLNKKEALEYAAGSSLAISKIDGAREGEIKNYLACILGESAKMAQSNLNLQNRLGNHTFNSKDISFAAVKEFKSISTLDNPSIRMQYKQAINSLRQPCRFLASLGHDSIQCGTLVFSFTDNSIKQSGVLLSVGPNFYGVSSTIRVSMSDINTIGHETSRESSQSSSRDSSLSQTKSESISHGTKQQINVLPFLPK
jgi:hypothetical protein